MISEAALTAPFLFEKWLESQRPLMKPPVGNRLLWRNTDFIVMVVSGPNDRTDFHINPGEEIFFQIEGDISLRIQENGTFRDIPIRQGEIFLLPPGIPHSPKRPSQTLGIVVEKQRPAGKLDSLVWYCEQCVTPTYQETFQLTDIETQFGPVFARYNSDPSHKRCKHCDGSIQ